MLWQGVDVPHDESHSSFLRASGVRFRSRPSKANIAIIGGGLAGLVAGFEAMSLGFNVQIYEGRAHRNGGRIQTKSDFVPSMWAEAGPEFISPAHEILLWYIRRFGLGLIQTEGMENSPFTPILFDERIDLKNLTHESELFRQVLVERSNNLIQTLPENTWRRILNSKMDLIQEKSASFPI